MTSAIVTSPAEGAPRWEDQAVFRVNKEAPHATKMPFPTEAGALTKTRMESPWCLLLNGEWKFHWSPTVEEHEKTAENFYATGFDDSAWDTIPVPSNVELQGYGTPIYRGTGYVFQKNPPSVTDEPPADWTTYKERSPVSAYRRTVTMPEGWSGRNVFIVFNGVESAFTLYVNGQEVGYSQDSRTPAEFNITKYLKAGENLLAVKVHRFSDGSYLEDQDMWRLSGIFRDVYLWSSDQLTLRDIEINASLDEAYEQGVLELKTSVFNHNTESGKYSLEAALVDAEGQMLAEQTMKGNVFPAADHISTVRMEDLPIKPWSAEAPNLYTLKLALKGEKGNSLAHYALPVGFKTVEVKDGNLLVNGQPILIKGVNRHDHDHRTGHYVPEETMRAELDLMKRLNINAIRTSHYPNDPRFLELVNEYGFYVISEANIETHGFGNDANNQLAIDPSWRAALADRVKNMVETFKNQPCIISWSLGNEAGTGPNFQGMALWVQGRDPSRPVHYEGARRSTPPYGYVDFESPMYFRIGDLDKWCRTMEIQQPERQKPMIQCEYSHAMGNSCGGLDEYWEIIRRERLLQGGFIWDWRDQGILQTKPANKKAPSATTVLNKDRFVAEDGSLVYFAYGGDFGDQPNDNNFCMNGIVGADLVPNPHAAEVAYQYRSILTSGVEVTNQPTVVKVFNEHFFTTITNQPMRWTLLEDGVVVKKGELTIEELAPQAEEELIVPLQGVKVNPKAEYILNVEYPLTADQPWAEAGFVMAHDQLPLGWTPAEPKPYVPASRSLLPARKLSGKLIFDSGQISAAIDEATGQLVSYKIGRVECIQQPLQLNFWRAPVDNDRGNDMPEQCEPWREAAANAKITKMTQTQTKNANKVTFDLDIPVGESKASVTYSFYCDGALEVALTFEPKGNDLPPLPRVGFQCAINSVFNTWEWYGRGPVENYSDRNESAFVGKWKSDVREAWFPYAEPQETANRMGVREAVFSVGRHGLLIRPTDGKPLELAAYPFLQSDLEGTKHPADIPLRDLITVQISHRQMGVGGEDSWGAWPRPDHILPINDKAEYAYSFVLKPF